MNKKIWNVCTTTVETRDGKDAFRVNFDSTNSTPDTTKSFDSYEDAKAYWETIGTRVYYNPFHGIYVHTCKYIEPIVVDEDGEFVEDDGCIWDDVFPDYVSPYDDEVEDED